MKKLKELVEILAGQNLATNSPLSPIRKHTKLGTLLDLLTEQKVRNDEEAKILLYGSTEGNGYSKLKHQLRGRLSLQVLLMDGPADATPVDQAYYQTYRNFVIARFLLRWGGRRTAIWLIHKVCIQAEKYQFTDLHIEALRLLRYHYGVILGNWSKAQQYQEVLCETLSLYRYEILADGYLEELLSHYVKNGSTKKHLFEKALAREEEVRLFLSKRHSQRLQHRLFFIQVAKFMSVNDYSGTINTCRLAIEYFKGSACTPNSVLRTYLYQIIVSYIQQRQYTKAREMHDELMQRMQNGLSNWFKALEIQCKLELHAGQYTEAYAIWQQATQHSKFRKLYPQAKEKWKVLEAYIVFLHQVGSLPPPSEMRKFRIGRFLNEVPTFSRDKRGLNIPILIIQILFLIYKNRRETILDRMEALERYTSRYLKYDEDFRSNCFIKMLLKIPKSYFRRVATERNTEALRQRLQGVPLEMASEAHEIEIIPYEDLWVLVLNGLK